MTAEIVKGTEVAAAIKEEISLEMERLKEETGGGVPGLAIILVGDNPVSKINVNNIEKTAQELQFNPEVCRLPPETTEEELIQLIENFNHNKGIHGIVVQLPLPYHIDDKVILEAVLPEKDVEGLHSINKGRMLISFTPFLPCTPYACLKILEYINFDIEGKRAVVVGRSNNVGKPIAMQLLQKNVTVTICHSHTVNPAEICRKADFLVVAVGRPELVKKDWVKPGGVVIDVGVNKVGEKVIGDVDFEEVSRVASYITPVPGGLGPVTTYTLMLNTLHSFKVVNDLA